MMKTSRIRVGLRAAWMLCFLLLLSCQQGVLIEVHLSERPAETVALLVSAELNGFPAVESARSLSDTRDRFYVQFPASIAGRLKLILSAQNLLGCELAHGSGTVEIAGDGVFPMEINLTPEKGCALDVEIVGPGSGQVTSNPAGIDCGSQCRLGFERNKAIALMAKTTDLFGGWFADATVKSCVGRVSCAVTIGSGVTRVRANFIRAQSCSPSGWCVEETVPTAVSQADLYALWGSGRDDVWAVGDSGVMLHGDGILWNAVAPITNRALRAVWGSEGKVWAVGESGTMLYYDGTSWKITPMPTQAWLNGIWGSRPQDIWAVGDFGTILHYDGSTWTAYPSGTSQSLRGVWGSSDQDVWAVGDGGTLLRWVGAVWEQIPTGGTTGSLYSVWGTDASNIWMVGDGGLILRWGGGLPLSQTRISGVGGLHAVWGTSPNQVWAVGDSGAIVLFKDAVWSRISNLPSSKLLAGIWGSGLSDVWTLGQDGTILRFRP